MLNNTLGKTYHDFIHFYFDRSRNINVLFSMNLFALMGDFFGASNDFLENNYVSLLEDLQLTISILDSSNKEIYSNKITERIPLIDNTGIETYFIKANTSGLKGKHKIKITCKFPNIFYKYKSDKQSNDSLFFEYYKSDFAQKSANYLNEYSIDTDEIDFGLKNCFVNAIRDITQGFLTYSEFIEYIDSLEEAKGIKYDNFIPITSYLINNEVNRLNFNVVLKKGDKESYHDLLMNIFQNNAPIEKFENLANSKNIFLLDEKPSVIREDRKTYERLPTTLESSVCDNDVFANLTEYKEILKSEMLWLSLYYQLFPELSGEDYWSEDFYLIPPYIVDVLSVCDIFLYELTNPESMSYSWKKVSRSDLELLPIGRYLCKVISKNEIINKHLIENYFVLVK